MLLPVCCGWGPWCCRWWRGTRGLTSEDEPWTPAWPRGMVKIGCTAIPADSISVLTSIVLSFWILLLGKKTNTLSLCFSPVCISTVYEVTVIGCRDCRYNHADKIMVIVDLATYRLFLELLCRCWYNVIIGVLIGGYDRSVMIIVKVVEWRWQMTWDNWYIIGRIYIKFLEMGHSVNIC